MVNTLSTQTGRATDMPMMQHPAGVLQLIESNQIDVEKRDAEIGGRSVCLSGFFTECKADKEG
jgi:hypothetical protein